MPEDLPFNCTVCGAPFGLNPRLRLWLTGNVPASEFPKVPVCWVCARLRASVDLDAARDHAWMEKDGA